MDKHSKIAILGYGVEGAEMLKFLRKKGFFDITVCDKNVDLEVKFPQGVSSRLGENYLDNLQEFEVIFRSPGIPFLNPKIQTAIIKGSYVTSVTDFFVDQCPCPIIGISGTKGKGTTSTLIYKMLKKAKLDVYLGGNIGEPPVKFLSKLNGKSLVVLELSSFQLQDLRKSPRYAILLNTTQDHLDYHADSDEYLKAKEALIQKQRKDGMVVMNEDYEYTKYYKPLVKARLCLVSTKKVVKNGAYALNGEIFYAKNGKSQKIMKTKDVGLTGAHNLENILPALVIAKELGVKNANIISVAKSFKGLPNRLEMVRKVGGVKYYNDSFSTTPETSMAAVDSFEEPTILIAGGSDKGLDYHDWALKILTRQNLHTVILIGETADKMDDALHEADKKLGNAAGFPTRVLRRKDLEEAILEAYTLAEKGSVVVMSPAAASFDMFANYKERGEKFRTEVKRLRENII